MAKLEKTYDPKQVEDKWYARWEASGVFHGEASEIGIGVLIETHLLWQELRIKTPAFSISGIAAIFAKLGNALQFLRDRKLHVMARYALMIGKRLHLVERHILHPIEVCVIDTWP